MASGVVPYMAFALSVTCIAFLCEQLPQLSRPTGVRHITAVVPTVVAQRGSSTTAEVLDIRVKLTAELESSSSACEAALSATMT